MKKLITADALRRFVNKNGCAPLCIPTSARPLHARSARTERETVCAAFSCSTVSWTARRPGERRRRAQLTPLQAHNPTRVVRRVTYRVLIAWVRATAAVPAGISCWPAKDGRPPSPACDSAATRVASWTSVAIRLQPDDALHAFTSCRQTSFPSSKHEQNAKLRGSRDK